MKNAQLLYPKLVLVLAGTFLSAQLFAQSYTLKGRVVDGETEEAIAYASVFINTTTIGTTTDTEGRFELQLPAGSYELVISYVGYEPIVYLFQAAVGAPSFLFKLKPTEYTLDEVEIKAERGKAWYQNLEVFKKYFLGNSTAADRCTLLNPEVLSFTYEPENGLLNAQARELLQIENQALGYRIDYLLIDFNYDSKQKMVTFLGYPRYTELQGSRRKQRRWQRNRERAYRGSTLHFLRALRQNRHREEGFRIRRLIREPNPNRPSEEEIAAARAEMRRRGEGFVLSENDSLAQILRRSNEPEFVEKMVERRVPVEAFLHQKGEEAFLKFEDYLIVVYTKEREQLAYVNQSGGFERRKPGLQTSVISLRRSVATIEPLGYFTDPLSVLLEGYWGWEKVADSLALDYELEE